MNNFMKTEHFTNFDTLAAVKQLHAAGLEDRIAEAIVNSISISRRTDLSNLVSKDDFFEFKEEVKESFNQIDQKFSQVDRRFTEIEHSIESLKKDTKSEIESLKKDTKSEIESLKKDTKSEMELLRKDIIAQMAVNKNSITQWLIGLFIVLMIAIFVKPHF